MSTITRARAVLGLGAAIALLTGCSTADTGVDQASVASEPVRGGEITWAFIGFFTCTDVVQSSTAPLLNTVDNVIDIDYTTGEILPWLATSWEANDDYTEFSFVLRDDVTFSNGEVYDAEAQKLNVENVLALIEEGRVNDFPTYQGYVDTEITGEYEYTVRFDRSRPTFLEDLANDRYPTWPIAPASIAQTPDERCIEGVSTTGPFSVSDVTDGESLVLNGREDYAWPSALYENTGAPYLEKINVVGVPENSVRTGGLISGDFDIITNPPADDKDQIEAAGDTYIAPIQANPLTYYFNYADDRVTSELAVRQAISHGIDRQAILDAFYTDEQEVLDGYINSELPGAIDLGEYFTYDPELSAQLLDDAGWELADDGYRYRDGEQLQLVIRWPDWFLADQFEFIQQQLREIGVNASELLESPTASYSTDIRTGDWDLAGATGPGYRVASSIVRTLFYGGSNVYASVAGGDDEVDATLDAILVEPTLEGRLGLVQDVQRLVAERAYSLPVTTFPFSFAYGPQIHGLTYHTDGVDLELRDVWLEN